MRSERGELVRSWKRVGGRNGADKGTREGLEGREAGIVAASDDIVVVIGGAVAVGGVTADGVVLDVVATAIAAVVVVVVVPIALAVAVVAEVVGLALVPRLDHMPRHSSSRGGDEP